MRATRATFRTQSYHALPYTLPYTIPYPGLPWPTLLPTLPCVHRSLRGGVTVGRGLYMHINPVATTSGGNFLLSTPIISGDTILVKTFFSATLLMTTCQLAPLSIAYSDGYTLPAPPINTINTTAVLTPENVEPLDPIYRTSRSRTTPPAS